MSSRGRAGRGVAADLVSRVADLGPDRTDRAEPAAEVVATRPSSMAVPDAIARPPRALPSTRSRPRSRPARSRPASSMAPTTSTSVEAPPGSSRPRPAPTLSPRRLLGPQWPGPVRLPFAGRQRLRRGALELGKLKATDGAFGYDLPRGPTRPTLPARSSGASSSRTSSRSLRLTPSEHPETNESQVLARRGERVPCPETPWRGPWRDRARRNSDSLTADARKPTGSRR